MPYSPALLRISSGVAPGAPPPRRRLLSASRRDSDILRALETGSARSVESRVAEGAVVERKLAAILAADVVGYSSLMGRDEGGTLRVLTDYRAILSRLVAAHRGRIFTTAGDSVTAEFASAVDAL